MVVFKLVRKVAKYGSHTLSTNSSHGQIFWDPDSNFIDIDAMDAARIDVIVNLAGENVHQRWTPSSKERIMNSRLRSTELLRNAILRMKQRPKVFISASGISYYHNQHDGSSRQYHEQNPADRIKRDRLFSDESSDPGTGFLSEICQEWEKASSLPKENGIRIVNLRIGIVLGTSGGVLQKLLPVFNLGLGGKWGDGSQYMSWIGIGDLVRIINFAITNESVEGPVNAVSPVPVTNAEFAKTLGRILSRPTFFSVPGWLARRAFGVEWVESTLLADYRIKPAVLMENGYNFEDPELEPFLRKMLLRKAG